MKPRAVYPVPWMPTDSGIDGAVIIGRANIDYPNGGRTHGLVIRFADAGIGVVYFDRTTLRFLVEPLSATS